MKTSNGGPAGPPFDILAKLVESRVNLGELLRSSSTKGGHGGEADNGDERNEKRVLDEAGTTLVVNATRDPSR